jgi:hypothetical protein
MSQGIPGSVGYKPDCLTCQDTGYADSCANGRIACPAKCEAAFNEERRLVRHGLALSNGFDPNGEDFNGSFLHELRKRGELPEILMPGAYERYRSSSGHIYENANGSLYTSCNGEQEQIL